MLAAEDETPSGFRENALDRADGNSIHLGNLVTRGALTMVVYCNSKGSPAGSLWPSSGWAGPIRPRHKGWCRSFRFLFRALPSKRTRMAHGAACRMWAFRYCSVPDGD